MLSLEVSGIRHWVFTQPFTTDIGCNLPATNYGHRLVCTIDRFIARLPALVTLVKLVCAPEISWIVAFS